MEVFRNHVLIFSQKNAEFSKEVGSNLQHSRSQDPAARIKYFETSYRASTILRSFDVNLDESTYGYL